MSHPVIRVEQGELEGGEAVTDNGHKYYYFKGIPYAEPPTGSLRFKPPIPIKLWTGRKIATMEGKKCPQLTSENGQIIGNENCLFINVYTPSLPKQIADRKPYAVMVFIHGGGFRVGSGDSDEFGPDFFMEKDTILVTFNYRLGALGFLCLDIPEVPGNAGLRDQNLALRWIKTNICHFNGDSDNVTLFGISAGSASVEYQMLSSMSEGLFHKSILQSGSSLSSWTRNRAPIQLAHKFKNVLKIPADSEYDLLRELQDTKVEDLITGGYKVIDEEAKKSGELFGFAPVVEKSFENIDGFLTIEPAELLKTGRFLKVPTITGFCSNEGAIFKMFYGSHVQKIEERRYSEFLMMFRIDDKDKLNAEITNVYKSNHESEIKQVDNFLSDLMFISGIRKSLEYRLEHTMINKDYCYMFSFEGNLKADLNDVRENGALHASELPYLSKIVSVDETSATSKDRLMRSRLIEMWTNFAKFGNPTPHRMNSTLTPWTPITRENLQVLEMSDELTMRTFPWAERSNLWQGLVDNTK